MITDIDKTELINNYIKEGHSQEECTGFIEGLNRGVLAMRRFQASQISNKYDLHQWERQSKSNDK